MVGKLAKGRSVVAVERTKQSYALGALNAPWYRIKEPEGWVFGVFLAPKEGGSG